MGGSSKLAPIENTALIKENHRRESRSATLFMNNIPNKMPKDHVSQPGSAHSTASSGAKPAATAAPSNPAPAPPGVDPMRYPTDVETRRMNDLSMKLWKRVNSGYLIPTRRVESLSTADFKYNEKLIEKTDRTFMHKRDLFSEYVEAAARMGGMLMNKKPLADRPVSRGKNKGAAPKAAPAAAAPAAAPPAAAALAAAPAAAAAPSPAAQA